MDEKKREKYIQSRYRRELERYLNRVVGFVMGGDFDKGEYDAIVEKGFEKLEKVEKAKLFSDYFESLEDFVQKSRELKESDLSADEVGSQIVYEANQIRKSKRKKSYNRKERRFRGDDERDF